MQPIARNIDRAGQRRRYLTGAIALGVGAAAAAGMILGGAPRGLRLALVVLFWLAALLLFQARECT
jgi:hypothetical protein